MVVRGRAAPSASAEGRLVFPGQRGPRWARGAGGARGATRRARC